MFLHSARSLIQASRLYCSQFLLPEFFSLAQQFLPIIQHQIKPPNLFYHRYRNIPVKSITPWVLQKVFRKFTAVDACLNVISVVVQTYVYVRFTFANILQSALCAFYYVNYPRRLAIDRIKYSVFFFSVSTFKRIGSIYVLTPATPWFVAGLTVMFLYTVNPSIVVQRLLMSIYLTRDHRSISNTLKLRCYTMPMPQSLFLGPIIHLYNFLPKKPVNLYDPLQSEGAEDIVGNHAQIT